MTAACEACDAPQGPACRSLVDLDGDRRPCERCGGLTYMRTACGRNRHHDCRPVEANSSIAHTRGRESAGVSAAVNDRRWIGAEKARAQQGALQPMLRDELAELLEPREVDRAVALWNANLRGIAYGGAHRTALGILNGTFKHRGIPELPETPTDALKPLSEGPVWNARQWVVAGAAPAAGAGYDLAGFDVNGMYLSAAAIELGTGAPERAEWPGDAVLTLPGWVRVSTLEGAPWSIGHQWQEGMWMPTPLVAYLRDAGAEFLITESLTWTHHRRWLDPHVDLLRHARTVLMADGTPAAREVLAIVKELYARMFGGLLESETHNDTRTLRPDWKAAIVGTAQARMFRALDKTRQQPTTAVVGFHADAAWFVMPRGWKIPPGLIVSDHPGKPCPDVKCHQLGKWKPSGRTPWTADLAAAWERGEHRTLWKALDDA